jgi:hypothetical protein
MPTGQAACEPRNVHAFAFAVHGWGNGLSTEEMEWQVAMAEKFGNHATKWPEELKKANSDWYDAMRKITGIILHGRTTKCRRIMPS